MKVTTSASLWISILLQCATFATAQQTISASGPLTPCPGYHLSNSSNLNATLSPSTGSLFIEVSGLNTVPGNATLSVALITGGETAYNATFDPCTVGIVDLCPAYYSPTGPIEASVQLNEGALNSKDLGADVEVRLRLWVDVTARDQSQRQTACVERMLQNGYGAAETGGNNSSSAQGGNGDTTNSTNESDGADSSEADSQDSGAGSMGAALSLLLLTVVACYL